MIIFLIFKCMQCGKTIDRVYPGEYQRKDLQSIAGVQFYTNDGSTVHQCSDTERGLMTLVGLRGEGK